MFCLSSETEVDLGGEYLTESLRFLPNSSPAGFLLFFFGSFCFVSSCLILSSPSCLHSHASCLSVVIPRAITWSESLSWFYGGDLPPGMREWWSSLENSWHAWKTSWITSLFACAFIELFEKWIIYAAHKTFEMKLLRYDSNVFFICSVLMWVFTVAYFSGCAKKMKFAMKNK